MHIFLNLSFSLTALFWHHSKSTCNILTYCFQCLQNIPRCEFNVIYSATSLLMGNSLFLGFISVCMLSVITSKTFINTLIHISDCQEWLLSSFIQDIHTYYKINIAGLLLHVICCVIFFDNGKKKWIPCREETLAPSMPCQCAEHEIIYSAPFSHCCHTLVILAIFFQFSSWPFIFALVSIDNLKQHPSTELSTIVDIFFWNVVMSLRNWILNFNFNLSDYTCPLVILVHLEDLNPY